MLPSPAHFPDPDRARRQGDSPAPWDWKALLLPAVALAVALGCGGGGSSPSAQLGGGNSTADAEGIYTGSLVSTSAGTLTAYAAITPAGQVRYVASNNGVALAQISTGSGTFYTSAGTTVLTLSSVLVTSGASVSGSYALATGDSGTFAFTYNSLYLRPPVLSALAGSYTSSQTTTGTAISVTLDTSGNVTGDYTGTLTQLSSGKNLYQVNLTSSANGNTYSGLAFWADAASGLVANSFYLQVSGVNNSTALGGIFTLAS